MNDGVLTVEPLSNEPKWKTWLKFFGILPLTLHEAVMSGSLPHVKWAMDTFMKGKKANPDMINAYNVRRNRRTILVSRLSYPVECLCVCFGVRDPVGRWRAHLL